LLDIKLDLKGDSSSSSDDEEEEDRNEFVLREDEDDDEPAPPLGGQKDQALPATSVEASHPVVHEVTLYEFAIFHYLLKQS
jgi:hypothetical protein